MKISVALPPVSRSVEIRIVREVDLFAAVVGLCKAAIALPARAITCIVKISVFRNGNGFAKTVVLEEFSFTGPWPPIAGPIQKGVLGNGNFDACVAVDLVASITQPGRPMYIVRQIRVRWQNDFQTETVDLHVTTKATPTLSRWVEISAIGDHDFETGRVIDLLKPM